MGEKGGLRVPKEPSPKGRRGAPRRRRGPQGGVADSAVAEVFTDDGAVFLLDVGVAVLMSWEEAVKVGVGPFSIEVTVDDGVEEFVAVVGVEAFGGGRLGGKIAFEGGEVIGGAEIETSAGLNPLETTVYGGRDPKEVTGKIAAAEGHAVGLDVAGGNLVRGTILAGLDGNKGATTSISAFRYVLPRPFRPLKTALPVKRRMARFHEQ